MLDSERELPCSSKGHRKHQREKLPSMEVLISQGKALLAKKRKERHLEFSTDPVSGNRSYKGTYSSTKIQKRNEARNSLEGGDSLNFLPAEGT